ncbi:MAG: Pyruvate formate-lyase activating enzyme [Rariglobus sp.]|nr:Pyruvate formate-lyase activating enzyme [Rariglobus sp.]
MNDITGIVFDIQRGALHDGPGVRTTVFLKGCPLRCAWCHNPESQTFEPETGRSGRIYGRALTVTEVMAVVRRDARFYAASGGGLTISGGEPTAQYDFCSALLAAAHGEGIHTCLDTCGALDWPRLDALCAHVDVFLYDYKATAAGTHRALTGIEPGLPHANLRRLLAAGATVRLRCPLIPDANAAPDHLDAIAALGRDYPAMAIDLMPYHEIGAGKYDDLGRPRPALETRVPAAGETAAWLDTLHSAGAAQAALG